jgi:hypothetical protein
VLSLQWKQLRVHTAPSQAKSEPPQLQRRRLLLRYWAAALDATGELVLHAGSLETVVATHAKTLDQAQLKVLLGEAEVTCRQVVVRPEGNSSPVWKRISQEGHSQQTNITNC